MKYSVTITTTREDIFSAIVQQAMRLNAERIELVRLEDVKTTVKTHDRIVGVREAIPRGHGKGRALVRSLLADGPKRYAEVRQAMIAAGMAGTGAGGLLSKMQIAGEIRSYGGLWSKKADSDAR